MEKDKIVIVDGKKINLTQAEQVAEYSFSDFSDVKHVCETLYRTKKGTWVLRGEGGPLSRYAVSLGGGSSGGGSETRIVGESEAFEFTQAHAEPEIVMEYFDDLLEEV